ncbi:hypothetical protein BH10PSE2_BH10PSE2_09310 [soil metagenome]
MTYIEPDQPSEMDPSLPDQPEIDPGVSPDELPPLQPGGGDVGDSRPVDAD